MTSTVYNLDDETRTLVIGLMLGTSIEMMTRFVAPTLDYALSNLC